ncbi:UNVERIFIED_ORG: hypothetical protein ABIB52_001877 [Arthrobacter sp. UYCu721]
MPRRAALPPFPDTPRTRLPYAGTNRIRFEGLRLSALSAPACGSLAMPVMSDGGAPLS